MIDAPWENIVLSASCGLPVNIPRGSAENSAVGNYAPSRRRTYRFRGK